MLKDSIKETIVVTQFHKYLQWLHRKRIIILMYHGFYDESKSEGIEQYGGRWCGIGQFNKQMQYLRRHYNIITLEQLVEHYLGKEKIPNNAVVITMDDGYRSNHLLAYPVLKQYQLPATVFVSTDFVENQEPLWTDRLDYLIWKAEIDAITITINNKSCTYNIEKEIDKIKSAGQIKSGLSQLSLSDIKI